jgi:hypothetical protein
MSIRTSGKRNIGGPFFIPAYVLAGAWQWLLGRHAYHDNPFEKAAVAAHARQMQPRREGG